MWDTLRQWYRAFRRIFASAERPTGPHLAVKVDIDEIDAGLGRQSYAPNWEFSYYKRDEIVNLAQVVYDYKEIDGNEYKWWQTHVRGWRHGDEIWLKGHYELEPTEYDSQHIDGFGLSWTEGNRNLAAALEDANIDYTEVTYDG